MRLHPLYGADPGTLARVGRRGGCSPSGHPLRGALVAVSAALRWPFIALERGVAARRLSATPIDQPPIFIIGHWRSGTAHMHHLMAKGGFGYLSPVTAGMPWESLGLAATLRPLLERFLPPDRLIDSMPIRPDSPQEDELALGNMTPLAFHHGLYFPERMGELIGEALFFDGCDGSVAEDWKRTFRYFAGKLSVQQGGKQLLLKNPAHTSRVGLIRELFPEAKFIHMVRSPYEVFPSMRQFYRALLPWLALQRYDLGAVDKLILSTYDRLLAAAERDTADLSSSQYAEVRYERLDADPIDELRQVYQQLELDGFNATLPAFNSYLASVRSWQKGKYAAGDDEHDLVDQHWHRWVEKWGYSRPEGFR